MANRHVWGGIKRCTFARFTAYFGPGTFFVARPSPIAKIAYAIYRIRRRRVGQLALFDNGHKSKRTRTRFVPFWGWAVPVTTKRRKAS